MKKVFDLCDALTSLCPNASFTIKNGIVKWVNTPTYIPTETEIQAKIAELEAAEPMRLLRLERNRRLIETDWVAIKAFTQGTQLSPEWKTYLQALRDLPATAQPQLDEQGSLINVTWPEVPE